MRILFLSGYSPLDRFMGTGEYNQRLFFHLAARGYAIHYVCLSEQLGRRRVWLRDAEVPPYLASLRIAGWKHLGRAFFRRDWKRWLLAPLALLGTAGDCWIIAALARLRGHRGHASGSTVPTSGRRRIDPARRELIAAAVAVLRPAVVVVNATFYGDCLDALPPPPGAMCKVILTHDVYHQRAESLRRLGTAPGGNVLSREEEAELLDKADVIVALQDEEAAVLREMAPRRRVVTVPMAPERLPDGGVTEVAGRCLFVGSSSDHNVVGLAWFLDAVWPLIVARRPEASLHVCGRVGECFTRKTFAGVRFRGLVPDLGEEYAAAQVCLVPLRAGSGLKIKTVQALAQHKPCVVTGFGAQGMRHLAGTALVIADEPRDYADAVASLLADAGRREQLRAGAARAVAEYFSPDVCYQPLLEAISLPPTK